MEQGTVSLEDWELGSIRNVRAASPTDTGSRRGRDQAPVDLGSWTFYVTMDRKPHILGLSFFM